MSGGADRVVVIGGGICGLCSARHLQRGGLSWGATTGRLAAGLVGERASNFALAPYRDTRFAA